MKSETQHLADLLIQSGYRAIPFPAATVSRVDTPEWKTIMEVKGYPPMVNTYIEIYSRDQLQGIPLPVFEAVRRVSTLPVYTTKAELPPVLTICSRHGYKRG